MLSKERRRPWENTFKHFLEAAASIDLASTTDQRHPTDEYGVVGKNAHTDQTSFNQNSLVENETKEFAPMHEPIQTTPVTLRVKHDPAATGDNAKNERSVSDTMSSKPFLPHSIRWALQR